LLSGARLAPSGIVSPAVIRRSDPAGRPEASSIWAMPGAGNARAAVSISACESLRIVVPPPEEATLVRLERSVN
jgi:hypothetical protein